MLEAGVPALAEKPLGLRADDVKPLADLAQRRGAYVAVLFVNRLSPVWDYLPNPADQPVVTARFRINNGPIRRYPDTGVAWMTDPRQTGGGCLRNLGMHGANAVCQLAGDQPVEVAAATSVLDPGLEGETYGLALLRFGSGSVAVVEAGYNFPANEGGDTEWRVSTRTHYLIDQRNGLVVGAASGRREVPNVSSAERYERFVRLSIERLRTDKPPIADVADCYRAARIVDDIYDAAGKPVPVG